MSSAVRPAALAGTRVLGIDPGTRQAGWGVLELLRGSRMRALGYGVIVLPAQRPLAERLQLLWRELGAIIAAQRPDVAALEGAFFSHNAQSALKLGHARGVAMLAVREAGLALHEIAPALVKQHAVGHGRASKEQVQRMITTLLGLPSEPPEDASDALAVALALAHRLGSGAALTRR